MVNYTEQQKENIPFAFMSIVQVGTPTYSENVSTCLGWYTHLLLSRLAHPSAGLSHPIAGLSHPIAGLPHPIPT
jgi:hypothetical protein